MEDISKLQEHLDLYFDWNKARATCVSQFILGLFKVRSVNLTRIACSFKGKAKIASNYKRLQRFFRLAKMDLDKVAKFVAMLFPAGEKGWDLSIDRTNWKLGKKNINLLVLGIVYKGVAIPIMWVFLNKKGNSNTQERIKLINRFIRLFGKKKIGSILADREFIGKKWFSYLIKKKIPFFIRIKDNTLVGNMRGRLVNVRQLFRGKQRVLRGKRTVWGHKLGIAGTLLKSGELLIVVTNADAEEALDQYAKRWEIETLFACLKSRGFYFEDTHLTHPDRVNKLLALLTIAFCWAHITGEWLHQLKPIPIKKHGRKAQSIFRYGLDFLQQIIFNLSEKWTDFMLCLDFLLPDNRSHQS